MTRDLLLENVVSTVKTAKRFGLPVAVADAIEIVLSERLLRA